MKFGFVVMILIGIFVTAIKWILIIWGIIWLFRYLKKANQERQLFRLEIGKLAEQMQLIRQKLESSEKVDHSVNQRKDNKNAGSN